VTHPELNTHVLWAYAAIAVGVAVGVVGASWRGRRQTFKQEPTAEESESVTDHPSQAYHDDIKPLQEQTNAELVEKLRKAAKELAARMPDGITSDDIFDIVDIPTNVDRRIMGAVFNKAEWEHVGWQASRRRINHGRPIRRWRRKAA